MVGHSPYGEIKSSKLNSADPRTASSQSLCSDVSESDSRRTLLLVFIHGFYGNDQSFRSFPYHVHAFLRHLLADSHVIHTKIYPRYKTYRAIEVARDNFSQWLIPHESVTTDVILVGHSMGGILAADVVLMPNTHPYQQHPLKHRILGTVSLDTPFLGLHPGIIVSGISSLFQSPASPDETAGSSPAHGEGSALAALGPNRTQTLDPYFNPTFFNDKPFREAPFMKRIMNFANKHRSEGIVNATAKHVLSHLEYGGCLADYPALNKRYGRLRALEDVDELKAFGEGQSAGDQAKVRFVNYYTLSSGRKKTPKSPGAASPSSTNLTPMTSRGIDEGSTFSSRSNLNLSNPSPSVLSLTNPGENMSSTTSIPVTPVISVSRSPSPQLLVRREEDREETDSLVSEANRLSMRGIDPTPISDTEEQDISHSLSLSDLPLIPEEPIPPVTPSLDHITDKDARKQAEKEVRRRQKEYEDAVKEREKVIRQYNKTVEKHRRKARKDSEKEDREAQEEKHKWEQEQARLEATPEPQEHTEKPKKDRKFCVLPNKRHGNTDPTWVDIYMDGVDEVGAHCGLFFPGPHYDQLIGDVGSRILGWIQDDLTKRAIMDMN